jgi:hypothetical protein
VDFDRAHGDTEFVGDLLVELAGQHAVHDLAFAPAQAGQPAVDRTAVFLAAAAVGVGGERLDHPIDQIIVVEGLLDKVPSAFLQCGHGHRHVAVAGQEDDRQGTAQFAQAVEQFQAAHAVHADVQQQASGPAMILGRQEFLGRREHRRRHPARLEQPDQRVADRLVVIDDMDRPGIHGFTAGSRK